MTQTIREQLQALVNEYKWLQSAWTETLLLDSKKVINNLESILATEQPAACSRCNICGGLVQFDGTKPSVNIGPGGKQQ